MSAANRRRRLAFTLAELIVVAAVVGVAALVMLPSVGQVRRASRTVNCTDHLATFGQGLSLYTTEHAGWMPGENTSGVTIRSKNYPGGDFAPSHVPVQSTDWMSPVVSYFTALPEGRAQRWMHLWTEFGCPEQQAVSTLFGAGTCIDWDSFVDLGPWPACSYLTSAYFSLWGLDYEWAVVGTRENSGFPLYAATIPRAWWVRNETFQSHLNQVGPPDRKLFVADGTRYVTGDPLVTHDVNPEPAVFGAFTTAGGWWTGSTAYGVREGTQTWDGRTVTYGSRSDGFNLRYSYRHHAFATATPGTSVTGGVIGGSLDPNQSVIPIHSSGSAQRNRGRMNAVFFDGHVATLDDRQSRDIQYWYPTGSEVMLPDEGMTEADAGMVIP